MPLPADLLVATIYALPDTRKAFTPPIGPDIPALAILFTDGTPLRWADNTISEWAV